MRKSDYLQREREHFNSMVSATGNVWWGCCTPAGVKRAEKRALIATEEIECFINPAVLELGCGIGDFSRFILEKYPLLNFTGCDISAECVKNASERFSSYKNARFEIESATSLPYSQCSFDVIVGNAVLHHLPLREALQQCFKVLKPGGIILFFEPNMMNPQVAVERNIRFIGKLLQNSRDETAFFRWKLKGELYNTGFGEVSVKPFDFLHPLTPRLLINSVETLGSILERVPVVKEISGSLLIKAGKRHE